MERIRKAHKFTENDYKQIKYLQSRGFTKAEVMQKTGWSECTVRRVFASTTYDEYLKKVTKPKTEKEAEQDKSTPITDDCSLESLLVNMTYCLGEKLEAIDDKLKQLLDEWKGGKA